MNLTPIAKAIFRRDSARIDAWKDLTPEIQIRQLRWLLFKGVETEYGQRYGFEKMLRSEDPRKEFAEAVPMVGYEDLRADIMRMAAGHEDVLWPGKCLNFAQSSGTSGGRSKLIPVTRDSLRVNHYAGGSDVVGQYLRCFPESRMFSGKGLILGGSFDTQIKVSNPKVKIGDLSATLIDDINPLANLFRIPSKKIALMKDWHSKLDLIAGSAIKENITNLSGVPSWMLRVILRALDMAGVNSTQEIWPGLEVFFHGGISFEPYREEYARLTAPGKMNYFETYNASEGFFATQASRDNDGMLLLIDRGIFYEFMPIDNPTPSPLTAEQLEAGKVYEMIISSCNGLWRYRLGDTVEVTDVNPVKLRVAGRTKSFINAFGEELMENNAERAMAAACSATGAQISNYTAGPVYAHGRKKGRHQWLIEFDQPPADITTFREVLDSELKNLNSDYAAKRFDGIFLDAPEIIPVEAGTFDTWLNQQGNHKLGGQRKIPRLRNDRSILDSILGK
ncbi:MAG: GH3 auxin-responsive promoter family protein [Muribaculaceae bacterium]|nr:GH3 auxin-responsive promoter family protein [Muribaculaceae bacterium]